MTADYPDWGTEQAQANAISTTGVPLVHNNTGLVSDNFTFGAVGGSHVTPIQAIGQICYELYLSLTNALPAGSASYVQVTMDWFDQATGLQLARRRFKLVSGSNTNPHLLKIAGPVHGNQVKTTYLLTSDSVNLVTVASTLFGTSRLYQRDVMRTTIFGSDGFTAPGNIPEANVLINTAPLVAGNGQQVRLMAPYSGLVHCMGFTSSGGADMTVPIVEAFTGAPLLANQQTVAELLTNSLGFFDTFIALPHVQCVAQLNNRNAAQQTLSFTAVIQEPAN